MSGFYRYGSPGEDTTVHINTGRKSSGEKCAMPRFELDNPKLGSICGRMSVALCDGPADNYSRPSAITCDKPICELHRVRHATKPNTDFCLDHKSEART